MGRAEKHCNVVLRNLLYVCEALLVGISRDEHITDKRHYDGNDEEGE
jgi:hypothetical protein